VSAEGRARPPARSRRPLFFAIVVLVPLACLAAVLIFSSRHGDHGNRGGHPQPREALLFAGTRIGDFAANQSAPGAVREVPRPRGASGTALALTVHDRDVAPLTPTENPRAQLLSPALIEPGRTFWLSTAFFVPRSFPPVSSWLTLCSVYGPPATGSGPWDLAIDAAPGGGDLLMLRRGDAYRNDIPWAIPVPRGRWLRATVHERFSRHGFIELWIDGRRVTFFARSPYNPLGVAPTTRLRMATRGTTNGGGANVVKIMQYRRRGQFKVGTIYFAGLLIGTSRAAVEPSAAAARPPAG
jgi:Polysaccharide lyase